MSIKTEVTIQNCVELHLSLIKHKFNSRELDENHIFISDKIYFLIHMYDGQTLGFKYDKGVKYVYLESYGKVMTVVMFISGDINAQIENPLMIF